MREGRLPEDWKHSPLGELGEITTGSTPPTSMPKNYGGEIPFVGPGDLGDFRSVTLSSKRITEFGASQSRTVEPNTVFVSCIGILGKTGQAKHRMAFNQQINAISPYPSKVDPKFLYYLCDTLGTTLEKLAGLQVIPIVNKREFSTITRSVPCSIPEQQKIAQILDTLDTQIQKTEALIVKLEKIKEGLLQDLLTRGIDQNGQLRPTPEQAPELYKESALGLIPAEWELDYLGHLSESGLLNGVFKQPSRVGQGVPLINVADLYKGNKVNLDTCERFNASPTEVSKYSARKGDIFFTRSSLKLEGIAHCNWLDHDVADNSVVYECHVIRIRPTLKVDPHFLVSWCQSRYARRHFMANAKQVTMTTISQDGVASLKCPVPPLPEQTAAVERVKKLEDRIESELSVLKKIRHEKAGLMDDLLTGRVRVTFLLEDAV